MSSISKADLFLQSIRAQALERQRQRGAQDLGKIEPDSPSLAKQGHPDVAVYVAAQIRGISCEDPKRRHRAFRAFLEAGLFDLFGEDALSDPAFQDLLERTHYTLSTSSEFSSTVDRVIDALIAETDAARR